MAHKLAKQTRRECPCAGVSKCCRVRGPPGELDDVGDDEPQVHADAIDEEYEGPKRCTAQLP